MEDFIGRSRELEKLRSLYESDRSELAVVYGRIGVGKTHLVRTAFNGHFAFQHTGRKNQNYHQSLRLFRDSLIEQGMTDCPEFDNWIHAFSALKKFIGKAEGKEKKVIFLDEAVWMDGPRSEFLPFLEGFWNEWAEWRDDIILIISSSSAPWTIRKILRNRGGLYGRLTCRILLDPFTLGECEKYSRSRNLGYNRKQILLLYMVLGGIPGYWAHLTSGSTLPENIDRLIFSVTPFLQNAREEFMSAFRDPEKYLKIVSFLAEAGNGRTRTQIAKGCGLCNNGRLGEMMEELEEGGFIQPMLPFGRHKNDVYYRLTDNYILFCCRFLTRNSSVRDWNSLLSSPLYSGWAETAFGNVILLHTNELKRALGIAGINAPVYCWESHSGKLTEEQKDVHIPLLLDRADKIIEIIETRWTDDNEAYQMTKEDEDRIRNVKSVFREQTATRKYVSFSLVTPGFFSHNQYSDMIRFNITADDLFRERAH